MPRISRICLDPDDPVTLPMPRGPHADDSARAEASTLTLPISAGSMLTLGSVLDPRSLGGLLPTLGGRARLKTGIVFWARLNALICLGLTIVMRMTNWWFETGVEDAPWVSLLVVAMLLSASVAVDRLRFDQRRLEYADLATTVACATGFALMFRTLAPLETRELIFNIASAHLLMTRAAIVPSSGSRSLWTGCFALVPGVISCIGSHVSADLPWLFAVVRTTAVGGATVVASVLASRRIYGLQRQVNEARRLGPYMLVEKVGAGGMGQVFRARHALLRRPTAIKLIRPDSASESSLMQFEREAQITSQLTHPSTIQIHDFGRTEGGVFYYAMEYIEGLTLDELVTLAGPQPASRAIAILVQICGSLAEAHSVGLVHRDIKPANIMLCERGRVADAVKVLDFGLVKLRGQPGNTFDSKSSVMVGTPGFMAPEAILDPAAVDARTDIYALGAVGYFLITGRPLFDGTNDVAVLVDQVSTLPAPMSHRLGGAVPADLDAIIQGCLSKDPRLRPQTADALSERLLACRGARDWSQARAQAWWAAHREVVQLRIRERSVSVNASVVVEASDEQLG